MAISLGNRAKMSTSTTGTGTISLGSAVSGYQSFDAAGITNGQTIRYAIEDGSAFEIGSGTYTSSGTTLTRSVTESSNSDNAITLSGNAEVFVTATVADLYINDGASNLTTTGVITGGTVEATSDTAAGDNAAMGFTSAEGLILTGQGSTNDVTIKNDADAIAMRIPTGTTGVTFASTIAVNNVDIATGAISLKNSGAQSYIRFYCEYNNAHYAQLQAPAHGLFSGNVTLTLPATTDTVAGIAATQTFTNKTLTSPKINENVTVTTTATEINQLDAITRGSLLYGNASGATARLAKGGANTVLTSDGTDISWAAASGGGASALTLANKTGNYTVVAGDLGKVINCTANTFTVSLTAAGTLGAGFNVVVWNTSATNTHAITIDPNGSETIDGLATLILRRGEGMQVVCDGSNFQTGNKKTMRGYADNILSTDARPVASGNSSIAMGSAAVASNENAVAIGRNTDATASGSVAIGYDAQAVANQAVALGDSRAGATSSIAGGINQNSSSYGTTGVNSVAFGSQAKTTNNSAVSIGQSSIASGYQSAAYSFNAVASGQDSFAGGSSTDATATNSTALGKNAQATHANATAVGYNAATSATNQVSLGASGYAVKVSGNYTLPTSDGTNGQVMTTNGSGAVSFADAGGGGAALYAANESSPTAQPSATGANAIAIGDSAISTASKSVALGFSRVDGVASFAATISNNTTSYGAIGNQSVALGQFNKAGANGIAIGSAFAISEGSQSVAIGRSVKSVGSGSLAMGQNSKANIIGMFAYTYGQFAAQGDSQSGHYVLKSDTTNATSEAMTTNNSTAAATNQIVAASDTCITFHGTVVAMQNGAQAHAGWEIKGMLVNDGGTTTLALGNVSDMAATNASSWAVTLSADNTNNALKVQVTGEASHNIRWVANIQTSEVTYA